MDMKKELMSKACVSFIFYNSEHINFPRDMDVPVDQWKTNKMNKIASRFHFFKK